MSIYSFLPQACFILLVMAMRITETVSWFPLMRLPPTHRSIVYVYRISWPECKRKRLDSMCSCWTCAAKGENYIYLLYWGLMQKNPSLFMFVVWMISFKETPTMMSLYSQDWSRWQQILCSDTLRKCSIPSFKGCQITCSVFAFNKSSSEDFNLRRIWMKHPAWYERVSLMHNLLCSGV